MQKSSIKVMLLIAASLSSGGCGDDADFSAVEVAAAAQVVPSAETLVPALAFYESYPDSNSLHLVDLSVEGSFPSAFTLGQLPVEPGVRRVIGYDAALIVAVPRDHPAMVEVPTEQRSVSCERGFNPVFSESEQAYFFELAPPAWILCTMRWEVSTKTERYWEYSRALNPEQGRVTWELLERGGNRAIIKHGGWSVIRGIANARPLLHLREAVPPKQYWTFGLSLDPGRTLEAGYHLLEPEPISAAKYAEGRACQDYYEQRAVERYNRENGTSFRSFAEAQRLLGTYERGELTRAFGFERNPNRCGKIGARLVEPLHGHVFAIQPVTRVDPTFFAAAFKHTYERTQW